MAVSIAIYYLIGYFIFALQRGTDMNRCVVVPPSETAADSSNTLTGKHIYYNLRTYAVTRKAVIIHIYHNLLLEIAQYTHVGNRRQLS